MKSHNLNSPFALLLLVLFRSSLGQSTIYVSVDSTDVSSGCGTTPVDACGSIQAALSVANSGDLIALLPGVYSGPGNEGLGNIDDNGDVTAFIDGLSLVGFGDPSEVRIQCAQNNRFLAFAENYITFIQNLTISYCSLPLGTSTTPTPVNHAGGAILILTSEVDLDNLDFQYNVADIGGALALKDTNASITNSNFFKNNATIFGGAISTDFCSLNISYSYFTANTASGRAAFLQNTVDVVGRGGAIFSNAGPYSNLVHCTFTSNRALVSGGAVQMQYLLYASIDFGIFSLNTVQGSVDCVSESSCSIRGGALHMTDIDFVVSDSLFLNNSVTTSTLNEFAEGGAIFCTAVINKKALVIDTEFYSNHAKSIGDNNAGGYGGAFLSTTIQVEMVNCDFELNYVNAGGLFTEYSSNGGAVWMSSSRYSVISNSVFFANHAIQGTAGAIFITDSPETFVKNCTFTANAVQSSYVHKGEGGAIVASHNSFLTILDSFFVRNRAEPIYTLVPLTYSGMGGAIYVQSASANITRTRFSNNHATTGQFDSGASGGAISLIDAPIVYVMDCVFDLNSARGYAGAESYSSSGTGGAFSVMFSTVIITSSHFNYNWVSAGGTEYSLGGAISIFYDNTNPGAIPILIKGSTFHGNIATGEICTTTVVYKAGEGGAIAVFGSTSLGVDIQNVLFLENVADTQSTLRTTSSFGGAIMLSQSSKVRLHDCNFTSNVANNGYAADISSITDSENSMIYLNLSSCYFKMATTIDTIIDRILAKIPGLSCNDGTSEGRDPRVVVDSGLVSPSGEASSTVRRAFMNQEMKHARHGLVSRDQVGRHLAMRQMVEYIRRRRLDSISEDSIVQLSPSVIVGAGVTVFFNPVFVGAYSVFAGNILTALLEEEYSADAYTKKSSIAFTGEITGELLNIIALKASVQIGDIRNASKELVLYELMLFNSSLQMNYDINVTNFAVIMGAEIASNHDFNISNPVLTEHQPIISYLGAVHSGFFDFTKIGTDLSALKNIESALFSPDIFFDNVHVRFFGFLALASTEVDVVLPGKNETSQVIPELNMHIFHGASVEFFEESYVHVTANVSVYDLRNNSCGIKNRGEVILGFPQVSWRSVIDMKEGCYEQTPTGTLTVTLSSNTNTRPLLRTKSNATILGTLNITLFRGNNTKLNLYGNNNPSNWLIFAFDEVGYHPSGGYLRILPPLGLGFISETEPVLAPQSDGQNIVVLDAVSDGVRGGVMNMWYSDDSTSLSLRGSRDSAFFSPKGDLILPGAIDGNTAPESGVEQTAVVGYKENLIVSEIACEQITSYYFPSPDGNPPNCSVCLKNSSCGYCFDGDYCVREGEGGCNGNFENRDGNCCPEMCNGNGNCKSDLSCECYFLFTNSSNCKEYSVFFYVIIFGCVFIVFFALLSLRYYISYRRQKKSVLEKLRKRLLSGEGGADTKDGGFVTNMFLQNLQQDLILRDVFVNNDEIKLEEKIGEGSFGVVYKATFRGAQVAVKQMRSPVFMQLSEKDIEEFRKEAYMMSRLRHPNIVLVMGVSVVEQEVAPPVSRSNLPADLDDDMPDTKAKVEPKAVKSICIITEYLEQGSLADILYGPNKIAPEMWSYELALVCALQAARGMLYLHSHSPPICHRDLKSSNLVVDDHWVVKVTDFGMSRMVPEKLQDIEIGLIADDSAGGEGGDEERPSIEGGRPSIESSRESITVDTRHSFNPMMTSNLGTTAWCAPELLTSSNKTRYSVKVDVYSFGLVLWELWERKRPYEELYSRFDIIDAIRAGKRPPISASCPPALKSLIQRCWHGQPARRPTFSYIVRYLKDELARIKRQRLATNSTSSSTSFRWSQNGGYTPPVLPGTSVDVSNPGVVNVLHSSVDDGESTGVSSDAAHDPSSWRRFLNQSSDEGTSPFGVSPAAAANKGSLVRMNSNGANGSPGTSPYTPPSSGVTGTWRDRYVMRFSGWQASRPDTGLPPSVSGTGTQGTRRTSSQAIPIPPPPARKPAPAEDSSSAEASPAVASGAFASMRNIIGGSSPSGRAASAGRSTGSDLESGVTRRDSHSSHTSQRSERSAEREREKQREVEASGRRVSDGVSLQDIEQLDAVLEVGSRYEASASSNNSSIDQNNSLRNNSVENTTGRRKSGSF